MTETLAPVVPAGWYDDPFDPASLRWWSGVEWTSYTSPKPLARVAPEQSAQTRGVWLLAFLPAMVLSLFGIGFVAVVSGGPALIPLLAWPAGIGLAVWFGWLDVRELQRRGYRPPSLLWMLLFPPLGYLIARGRMIRAQGGSAWGPEVVYVVGGLLGTVIVMSVSAQMVYAQTHTPTSNVAAADGQEYYAGTFGETGTPARASLEQMLGTAVASSGLSAVDCSDAEIARDSYVTCFAFDASSTYLMDVHICDCGDVYFSYQRFGDAPSPAEPAVPNTLGPHGTGNGIVIAQQNDAGRLIDERQPWVDETERLLSITGSYPSVSCDEAAGVVDLESTFGCQGVTIDGGFVDLDVTIDSTGDVSWTEYPLGTAPVHEPGESA